MTATTTISAGGTTLQKVKRYETRPSYVEAVRFTPVNGLQILEWADGMVTIDPDGLTGFVRTTVGRKEFALGEWIVQLGDGSFTSYTNREFVELYIDAQAH